LTFAGLRWSKRADIAVILAFPGVLHNPHKDHKQLVRISNRKELRIKIELKTRRVDSTGFDMRRVKSHILAFFLLLAGVSGAQAPIDSLKNALAATDNDSVKFRLLLRLSRESEFQDYTQSRLYADQAYELTNKLNEDWAKGEMYFRLAFLETMEGDYSDALKHDLQCVSLYSANGDSLRLARALNDVGTDYRDLGNYEESYFYLAESYRVAKKHARVANREDSLVMSIALHNIGTVFTELGQYDIALGHLKASADISAKLNDIEGPPYTHDEMGELYRRKKELDESEKYLLDALKEARQLKIRVLVPRIQLHLAGLYLDKKDFAKSTSYYDSVRAQQANINNRFGLAECDLGMGMVMFHSGNFESALQHYFRSLGAAKAINARNLQQLCFKELATTYEAKKDFEKSLYFLKQHDAIRDSIFSEASMEKLFQAQVRFAMENKDTEIAVLSEDRTRQAYEIRRQELISNILVIVVALTVILLFTVFRSGRRRKRINVLLLEHQEEIKRRSLELEQLNQVKDKFFSIISHDLRSPMNALAGTLELLDQKHITQEEFAELSRNLRGQFNHTRTLINNLLNWTLMQMDKLKIQPENISLRSKVEESFASFANLYPKNISMENLVDDRIMAFADPNIINLVLRNLILNAIKFTENGGHIWVTASERENEILVTVCDNGIGIQPEVKKMLFEKTSGYSTRGTANEKGTGLGLILCKEFIEKNGGKIWLESEMGKGTTFYFTIPAARVAISEPA
jgi:signal transduction histidine kinase